MKATDLPLLMTVGRPTAHPADDRVVVSVSHPSLDADANVGQLWSVPLEGGTARRITRGFRDTAPRFSPDGRMLAFLRSAKGRPAQVHVVAADGGEATNLTDVKLGVDDFAWSPDSRRIAFVAAVAQQGRYGTVDGIAPAAEPPRRVTALRYKQNGRGYLDDQRTHVFVVDVPHPDAEPAYPAAPRPDGSSPDAPEVPDAMQLTDGPFDDRSPRFDPDGDIAFTSAGRDGKTDLRSQVWKVPAGGGEAMPLTPVEAPLSVNEFAFGADGSLVFTAQDVGESGIRFVAANAALYRMEHGAPKRVTDPETRDLTEYDVEVLADGRVRTQDRTRGASVLIDIAPDGAVTELTSRDLEIVGTAVTGHRTVVTYQSAMSAGDVGIVEDGTVLPLTDFSADLLERGIVVPEEFSPTARDGYPLHGWVATPEGAGLHPTLLLIHGGPYAQFSLNLFDEVQVFVDAGYAVVFCNPRGSAGYGQAHGAAIRHAMGDVDLTDVLDFLDAAIGQYPSLDRERLGILGGSYGGYLTAWTIAHDHRFRAAIVERGYLGIDAFVGSSDIGWFFPQEYHGDRASMRAQSPQEIADNVRTPTLVIHSEDDLRTPLGQAETYWSTLKRNGVDTELLIFPGENHELSRSGRPRHRLQRFDAILDWLGRHL
jgi:dipeptidyl aminopeptidase/acylaminoacyl peptidase